MNFQDERDHEEESAVSSAIADEHRSESGRRVTVSVEWETANSSDGFDAIDTQIAEQLRLTLVSVAELFADFQINALVTSRAEKLGD